MVFRPPCQRRELCRSHPTHKDAKTQSRGQCAGELYGLSALLALCWDIHHQTHPECFTGKCLTKQKVHAKTERQSGCRTLRQRRCRVCLQTPRPRPSRDPEVHGQGCWSFFQGVNLNPKVNVGIGSLAKGRAWQIGWPLRPHRILSLCLPGARISGEKCVCSSNVSTWLLLENAGSPATPSAGRSPRAFQTGRGGYRVLRGA